MAVAVSLSAGILFIFRIGAFGLDIDLLGKLGQLFVGLGLFIERLLQKIASFGFAQ